MVHIKLSLINSMVFTGGHQYWCQHTSGKLHNTLATPAQARSTAWTTRRREGQGQGQGQGVMVTLVIADPRAMARLVTDAIRVVRLSSVCVLISVSVSAPPTAHYPPHCTLGHFTTSAHRSGTLRLHTGTLHHVCIPLPHTPPLHSALLVLAWAHTSEVPVLISDQHSALHSAPDHILSPLTCHGAVGAASPSHGVATTVSAGAVAPSWPGPLAGKQPGGDMRPNMRRKTGRCEQKWLEIFCTLCSVRS